MSVRSLIAALLCLPLLSACTSSPSSQSGSPSVAADAEAKSDAAAESASDVTFTMELTVGPGSESQQCQLVQVPSDRGDIAVPSAESHYTPGSHHFLAYRTRLTAMPDGGGAVVDCLNGTPDGAAFVTGSYYEAQQPDMRHDLPAGVAHIFKPGEVLALQAHYLNSSTEPVAAKITFKLHTMDPAKVEHEAGTILFSNFGLKVPAFSKVTQSRTCPVAASEDMNVALLWSHMHKRGVRFVASTDDPAVEGPLYESDEWSEPKARIFVSDPPTTVHAGHHITFACDFDNPTSHEFVYGPSAATNEMCILHGMYWPRVEPAVEFCLLGAGPPLPGADGGATGGDGGVGQ